MVITELRKAMAAEWLHEMFSFRSVLFLEWCLGIKRGRDEMK